MGKLVGDKKQKRFFWFVCTAYLCGFAFLLFVNVPQKKNAPDVTKESISRHSTTEPEDVTATVEPDSKETFHSTKNDVKVRGIYVTGPMAGSKKMSELTRLVETTELNTMVIDIKNDAGEITYKMDYDVAQQAGATKRYISDIQSLIKSLKEKGVYLIARIVTFKDPILAKQIPEYGIKNKDGSLFRDEKGLAWLNPYNREVWKYVLNIADRAALLGFDEIQFDYIRFPTAPGVENVTYGAEGDLVSKQDIITQFTKCMSDFLKERNVKVSADVFGGIISSEKDSSIIGQDYVGMSECLDCISPMIYPSLFASGCYGVKNPDGSPYEIVYRTLKDSQTKLDGNDSIKVRPWLQDFTASWIDNHVTYDAEKIRKQIEAVYASGYDEWILWNASNRYTVGGIK